jgi:cytosine deaminase
MKLPNYGIAIGNPADLVVLDCGDASSAVAELASELFGFKRGRRSFARPAPLLYPPT